MAEKKVPDIAFLGICEQSIQLSDNSTQQLHHSFIGLKQLVSSHLFPISLKYFQFVFALYDPTSFDAANVAVIGPDGVKLINFSLETAPESIKPDEIPEGKTWIPMQVPPSRAPGWGIIVAPVQGLNPSVKQPGEYKLMLSRRDDEILIGSIHFVFVPAPPLTEDRIAAIKSCPGAAKEITAVVTCPECGDNLRMYAGLQRNKELERDGIFWYTDLPNMFNCKCGKSEVDLSIMRENLHGLLGTTKRYKGEISLTRLYEKNALEVTYNQFDSLLKEEPVEEKIQTFIKKNPIILQQFSPERVWYKAPVLTKFDTDIVILNQKKELLFIELEKPQTRILTKKGEKAAPLTHAIHQCLDWLHMTEVHRSAVFECIDDNLQSNDVTAVRGIVVAGRDGTYDSKHVRKLKWADYGKITFFTYDDLLGDLASLIRTISSI